MTKYALVLLVATVVAQAGASAGVTVSWTDAVGSHSVTLTCDPNPEYTGDPWSLEPQYCWQGEIYVVMNSLVPIQFTFAGNFYGGSGFDYDIWHLVRVDQYVLNRTAYNWGGFHMWTANLSPDPDQNRDPTFYNMYSYEPEDWWVDMHEMHCNFYPEPGKPNPPVVGYGEEFYDVLKVYSDFNEDNGDGGFYLYKKPLIPEPSSMAAVAGCLAGLFVFGRRKSR
ncbi:MAG: hypothetical protein N3B12_03220 [Armatimonadetes bacterium]|nr:hypothetical protein [Armatimonadota bacterium]